MRRDGRVVDADIQLAEAPDGSVDDAVRAILGADIGDQRRDPRRVEVAAGLGQPLGVTVGCQDRRAGRREAFDHHPPDAARGAGDDDGPAGEIERHAHADAPFVVRESGLGNRVRRV